MKVIRRSTSKPKIKTTAGHLHGCPAIFMQTNEKTVRRLKIEEHGEGWQGLLKPKIRLMGRWLERAGFKPGSYVHIAFVAPGVLELRSTDVPPPQLTTNP